MTVLRTISLGTCISVQGVYVRKLPDGRIVVRDGARVYEGQPVGKAANAA